MFIVEGVFTTILLHRKILADADFRAGKFDNGFIERFLAKGWEVNIESRHLPVWKGRFWKGRDFSHAVEISVFRAAFSR